jgi:ParB family chromosome partitioning protein
MTLQSITSTYHERRLERTVLRTRHTNIDLYDLIPNDRQPRMGPKEDVELQRQIEANEGVFEPLLVEPHPEHPGKYRIIDGDRRWTNSRILVEVHKKESYRSLPAEITDRTLTDDERLRVWIYIHRQRKEWDTREKEMVAYRLVDMVGRASAANILGITVRELDKLVEVYELSAKLTNLREPGASITWAREIRNLSQKLLTPGILNAIVRKVNDQVITNSKDVRKLRVILRDPIAREEFLSARGTIETAALKIEALPRRAEQGLLGDLEHLAEAVKKRPWTELAELKGDAALIEQLDETARLLKELRRALSKK